MLDMWRRGQRFQLGNEVFVCIRTRKSKPCSGCFVFCGSGCTWGPDTRPRRPRSPAGRFHRRPTERTTPAHMKTCICYTTTTTATSETEDRSCWSRLSHVPRHKVGVLYCEYEAYNLNKTSTMLGNEWYFHRRNGFY